MASFSEEICPDATTGEIEAALSTSGGDANQAAHALLGNLIRFSSSLQVLEKPHAIKLILRVYHNPGTHVFADLSTNSQGDFIVHWILVLALKEQTKSNAPYHVCRVFDKL